jgi:hypothetical protein
VKTSISVESSFESAATAQKYTRIALMLHWSIALLTPANVVLALTAALRSDGALSDKSLRFVISTHNLSATLYSALPSCAHHGASPIPSLHCPVRSAFGNPLHHEPPICHQEQVQDQFGVLHTACSYALCGVHVPTTIPCCTR